MASPPPAAARPSLLSSRPCRRRSRRGWDRQTAGLDDIRASSHDPPHNRPNLGQAVHNAVGKERVGLMAPAVKNWWECTLLARLSAYACRAASAIDSARARSSVRPADTGYISSPARTLQRKRPAFARVSPDDGPRTDFRIYHELGARADRLPRQHRTGIQTREIGFARSRHFWSSGCRSKLPHKPILNWIDHCDPSLRALLHDPGFTVERTNPLLN